ncbi:DEAD/DEAH box helicase [Corynebacterium vitaeruminis]|uniref:DEAD/DEAH box helicase n=1 Tax=Corynebacterium vitaeruminis TaxID=38305 RepID=UPI0023EF5B40|nr:DEAD/DEAH box helicase [Corynebacterium vitaeruminis]
MPALNPTYSAEHVRAGISEYLATSFSLAEPATAAKLKEFLESPETGIFHGPYVRTRLPYAPAEDWEGILDVLPSWFTPYRHQAEAFRRLVSHEGGVERRPEPTLVVTGTGSGKTESFLYPILDHCKRTAEKSAGGIKALILYPMNALANDQERRLAELLADKSNGLGRIRAGIYTGESKVSQRTKVSEAGLITDRSTLRDAPPDILLTNYKMLDQLLLRESDREIWEKSAQSLQYLVLDEFHTYDGAQGTDVAMLLRRLGLMLKRFQPEGFLRPEEAARPLGRITPVATSATMGSGESGKESMLAFAHTVFGEKLDPSAIVGDTLLTLEQWKETIPDLVEVTGTPTPMPTRDVAREILAEIAASAGSHDENVHRVLCKRLFACDTSISDAIAAASRNELVLAVLRAAEKPIALTRTDDETRGEETSLVEEVFSPEFRRAMGEGAVELLTHVLSEIAYLRAEFGREHGWDGKKLPGVETHLWVRELSRIDRAVNLAASSREAMFRWSDDGHVDVSEVAWLPACYCRHCGRSGWMIQMGAGLDNFEVSPQKIRRGSVTAKGLQRPLIDATSEALSGNRRDDDSDSVVQWLNMELPSLSTTQPTDAELEGGKVVPVLTYKESEAEELAKEDVCPSCGERDSIRYIGAAVATLLSVSISNLFGMDDLDTEEKKTLVFADSVQDAAHRAGFVQGRARTFALRTRVRDVVGDRTVALSELPSLLMAQADASDVPNRARFELLPPQLANRKGFKEYWEKHSRTTRRDTATEAVKSRLGLDLVLEFGDRSDLARSLVSTGTLTVRTAIPDTVLVESCEAIGGVLGSDAEKLTWARGLIEGMRTKGGIDHEWFESYLENDANPYLLNRREARAMGIPPFRKGGSPKFPRAGARLKLNPKYESGAMVLGSPKGWYSHWTSRALGISKHDAGHLVTDFFAELAARGELRAVNTKTGGIVYAIDPAKIEVSAEKDPRALECTVCHMHLSVDAATREALDGAPCFTSGCKGCFEQVELEDNYYRKLYNSHSTRTVVSKEHTGLIDTSDRLKLEQEFKKPVSEQAPNSPNVLVATPTLEMGIDIGDLSTVFLSSMPKSVANYVQRVGRAGRLTGNSLIIALIRGRGEALVKLENPLETIAGSVQAPAAYLSAREILHRQFLAYLIDCHDLGLQVQQPRKSIDVFLDRKRTLLDAIEKWVTAGVDTELDAFCGALAGHSGEDVLTELREWVAQGLVGDLRQARKEWNQTFRELSNRKKELNKALPELEKKANLPSASEEDIAEFRSTRSAKFFINEQLRKTVRDEYWIAAMERYGLLPNFTLLDDAVEFHVSISKFDSENGNFINEVRNYDRGVSSALHELAPGATFYVQEVAAKIDSVEIGTDASSIQTWRFCPRCSYSQIEQAGAPVPVSCPQCGDAHFADRGQLIDVVEMTKVYASVDQDRSSIDSFADTRSIRRFQTYLSFAVPDDRVGESWFLKDSGFGAQYLPKVEMRFVNLGPVGVGHKKFLANSEIEAPLFRVCRHCGHLDSEADSNSWRDHKPWCPHRHALEEDSVTFALARRLSTQGVLLHLPQLLGVSDDMTIPSLVAAIKLGFKERLGGDPSHLDVSTVRAANAGQVIDVLLLHDTIPGGTGYLAQFTKPQDIRDLLEAAYTKLMACTCGGDGRLACPNCLLPFAGPNTSKVSRAAAISALKKLLTDNLHPGEDTDPLETDWADRIIAGVPTRDKRSELEARFLEHLRTDLKGVGARVTEKVVNGHANWTITFPSSPHIWYMREQVDYQSTIPDMVFATDDPRIRDIALYLDGAEYHISDAHNRLAGDVEKRNALYHDNDMLPWSMTWADIDRREQVRKNLPVDAPVWFDSHLSAYLAGELSIADSTMALLALDPMTQLLALLQDPAGPWDRVGLAAQVEAMGGRRPYLGCIDVAQTPGGMTLSMNVPTLGIPQEPWNLFWSMANLFYLKKDGTILAVDEESLDHVEPMPVEEPQRQQPVAPTAPPRAPSRVEESIANVLPTPAPTGLPEEWLEVIDEFTGEDEPVATLTALARAGAPLPDAVGEELKGLPTVAMWSAERIAVVFSGEAEDFVYTGYTIVEAEDSDSIPEGLAVLVYKEGN